MPELEVLARDLSDMMGMEVRELVGLLETRNAAKVNAVADRMAALKIWYAWFLYTYIVPLCTYVDTSVLLLKGKSCSSCWSSHSGHTQ